MLKRKLVTNPSSKVRTVSISLEAFVLPTEKGMKQNFKGEKMGLWFILDHYFLVFL